VRTVFAEHAEAPIRVAEGDQVLAEEAQANGCAVRFRQLLGEGGGNPVAAHELTHRRIALDAAQEFVFLLGQHGVPPKGSVALIDRLSSLS
jgi:hypothetical protein